MKAVIYEQGRESIEIEQITKDYFGWYVNNFVPINTNNN